MAKDWSILCHLDYRWPEDDRKQIRQLCELLLTGAERKLPVAFNNISSIIRKRNLTTECIASTN